MLFFVKVQGREWHLAAIWLTAPTRKAKEDGAAATVSWPSPSDPVTQSLSHPASHTSKNIVQGLRTTVERNLLKGILLKRYINSFVGD